VTGVSDNLKSPVSLRPDPVVPDAAAAVSCTRRKANEGDQQTTSMNANRDRDLVDALRRREPTAAHRLVTTYGARAYRLATGITGDAQDAEEVVQDALWTVVRRIDTFRGESAFGSWFYRIVANAAYQKLRGRQRRRNDLSLDEVMPLFDEQGRHVAPMADWSPRAEDPSLQTDLRVALISAINELPAGYRTALVLRDVEGLSNLEIAGTLRIGVPNVKARVHRARLFLRKRLGDALMIREEGSVATRASHGYAVRARAVPDARSPLVARDRGVRS
jgi:RNA polymerase sigma-70 factor, ECF subfamily